MDEYSSRDMKKGAREILLHFATPDFTTCVPDRELVTRKSTCHLINVFSQLYITSYARTGFYFLRVLYIRRLIHT